MKIWKLLLLGRRGSGELAVTGIPHQRRGGSHAIVADPYATVEFTVGDYGLETRSAYSESQMEFSDGLTAPARS